MDQFDRKMGAEELQNQLYFLTLIEEQKAMYLKQLENGDPSTPETLVRANLQLRAINDLLRKVNNDASQQMDTGEG